MKNMFSRRDVITKVFPAAALMGLGMGGVSAFAEETPAGETKNNWQDNVIGKMMKEAFENGQYKLPELPYSYDGLSRILMPLPFRSIMINTIKLCRWIE
jgi:hypothetical protein